MSLFLTSDEIQELTGYKLATKQAEWLRERRWVFEVSADGKPKVLRAYVTHRMGAEPTANKEPKLRLT